MSKQLWTGKTARQELVDMASCKIRVYGWNAHDAIEAVVDGAKPGTISGAMCEYYTEISQLALKRLIKAVEREAR